jgi:hypothetical protein
MKLCEVKQRTETAWPARWVEALGPGEERSSEEGVLEGLTRLGQRLLLRINVNGRRRTASLEWDGPPRVGDVEMLLLANIGAEIRQLGRLELPAHRGPDGRPAEISPRFWRRGRAPHVE